MGPMMFETAAIATARTGMEAGPAKRMRPVGSVRTTVTRTAGTGSGARLTPVTAAGKSTLTVSAAVDPKPFNRAKTQGERPSVRVHENPAAGVPVGKG